MKPPRTWFANRSNGKPCTGYLMLVTFLVWNASESRAAESEVPPIMKTSIRLGSRNLPIAPLGKPNPWPHFRFQIPDRPLHSSGNLSAEDRAGMFANAVIPPLPYPIQDGYTRTRDRGELPVIFVENAALRATVCPSLGGRMMSLYDKRAGRELLFDNPVLQFANLAIRNAWFSGGIEWNGPLYGHSLLTCSPLFAGVVETDRGPLLRLYEFDRALETVWQVDLFLPDSSDRLWVHIRAMNPNSHAIDFYWWTNIAVPLDPGTRVLSPLDYALSHDLTGISRLPFPLLEGFDGSYPARFPHSKSVFFRKPGAEKPWSVAVDSHGTGICHVSTPTLFGRKLFTWGSGCGGAHWMEFLSEEGKGQYIEIQGGVTPTQLQTRPLGAGAAIQWTECIAPFAIEPATAHGSDYPKAYAAAQSIIDARVPTGELLEIDAFLARQVDRPVGSLLHRGSSWGGLHEKRTGRQVVPGLEFPLTPGPEAEERPWFELLTAGTFSPTSLTEAIPGSFAVSPGWQERLRDSIQKHGASWLHHLHLGIASLEAGRFDEARASFTSSLAKKDNAMAHRCLALLSERDNRIEEARKSFDRAWKLSGDEPHLGIEICEFCLRHQRFADFASFVAALPSTVARHEKIELMKAQLALEQGDFPAVRKLIDREFCTIREGEVSLSDLWFASYIKEAETKAGRPLTAEEREKIVRDFPPPRRIDFRMK